MSFTSIFCAAILAHAQAAKPKLTLDEFFNSVSFDAVRVSPDGNSVVIGAERADWDQQIFRKELWLYRTASSSLVPLTQSGHDSAPQWSPDGQWIAFLSERKAEAADPDADEGKKKDRNKGGAQKGKNRDKDKDKDVAQLFLISPNGGEAIAITSGDEEVHAFAWSSDSKSIYFATRQPWTKDQTDEHKKDWKDTIRYRGDERGDQVFRLNVDEALARHAALGSKEAPEAEKNSGATPGAVAIARTPLHIDQLAITRDGQRLAFLTSSVSERQEKVEDVELFLVNLTNGAATNQPAEAAPIRLTRNQGVEIDLEWAPDNRHLFFQVNLGSAEGKYEDPQPRLYWVDATDTSNTTPEKRQIQRWFADFRGEVVGYTPLPDGSVLCACRIGTEIELIKQPNPKSSMVKPEGWPGTYEHPAAAAQSQNSRIAFAYSATTRPTEVYLADGVDKLAQARPITSFNKLFTERDLPQAKPYRWTSDDGTPVEGMLMYPPGKFEAKNLPMFVLIHGGPQDAWGNDWSFRWNANLFAARGYVIVMINPRGSTGYGQQ
ncbi:MAG: prolyl oligopeptidase family serine peptidase, partial [Terriglobales bacterium]